MADSIQPNRIPWYARTHRWGQTNLNEADPRDYDGAFWRSHWKRTRVQGIIVNAGGIVAYYPSKFPLQYRAEHLGSRDLFGEITAAARQENLTLLARMDSNRATETFYRAHPDWFAVDQAGNPCRAQDRYLACINSPYYREYLPQVLGEIIDRYHPDGFTDNSWSGMGRDAICYCPHCQKSFRKAANRDLPRDHDWDDPAYRQWIHWSYAMREEIWDLNNSVTQKQGGSDCLWLGMLHASPIGAARNFRDLLALGRRCKVIMCDHQSRDRGNGFEQNALNGKLLHGVSSPDALIPESMAMYVRGERPFRICANPAAESRTWMLEGLAGGISPWWHHIGARHEDHRQYDTAEPVMTWHEANEEYLYNRQPVTGVAIIWSQTNIDFYGRDQAEDRTGLPLRGWTAALTRARIPYLPLHADQIDEQAGNFSVLILPDLAAMSDRQCAAVRLFAARGGSIIATGATSLLDHHGDRRRDFALADLFAVHAATASKAPPPADSASWETSTNHTYLRLIPEFNQSSTPSAPSAARHAILAGFDATDLLPFGGRLQPIAPEPAAQIVATFVPPFPIYPPEFCWMRTPRTSIPTLTARELPSGGRIVHFAADIDRCYARSFHPDHADLLANSVRWAAKGKFPFQITGPGYLDCHLYRQNNRLILHIVNLTHARAWPMFVEEAIPVGPLEVTLAAGSVRAGARARLLVAKTEEPMQSVAAQQRLVIASVRDHEVVLIE